MNNRQKIAKFLSKKQDKQSPTPAILGDFGGTVEVSGKARWVYARLGEQIIQVYNARVPNIYGLPVLIGYDDIQPTLFQVLQINSNTMSESSNTVNMEVPYHHASHEWLHPQGGNDTVFVHMRQFIPGRVQPMGDFTVGAQKNILYQPDGTFREAWATGTYDLQTLVPSVSGTGRWVLAVQTPTQDLYFVTGTILASTSMTDSTIPAMPTGTLNPLAAIRLYANQDAIQESRTSTDIVDLRFSGFIPPLNLTGSYAPLVHVHAGTDITSGVIAPARLGTGSALTGTFLQGDGTWQPITGGGGAGGGHTIQDEGTPLAQRTNLNFVGDGVTVTDDAGNNATVVTIPGGGGGIGSLVTTKESHQIGTVLYSNTLISGSNIDQTIDQSYDHLIIRLIARSSVAAQNDELKIIFNGDTTATNYYVERIYAAASSPSAYGANSNIISNLVGASATAGYWTNSEIHIPNYSKVSTKYKAALDNYISYDNSDKRGAFSSVVWLNTSPITRITFQPDGYATDKLVSGTFIEIVGIKEQDIVTDVTGGVYISGSYTMSCGTISDIGTLGFCTNYTGTGSEPAGSVYWNTDEETLNLVMPDNVLYQFGEELFFPANNQSGADITDGTPVMFAGTLGASGRLLIQKAIADGSLKASYTMGLVTHTIANGDEGKVTWFGKVRGIDTTGSPYGEVWADGDILYISPTTAGYLTKVKPEAPDLTIEVAAVVHAAANGTLVVRPTWGQKLVDLDDVDGTTPQADYIMAWNTTGSYFDFREMGDMPMYMDALNQPTGFEKEDDPPTDSIITYNPTSRVLAISPVGVDFHYWLRGKRYTVSNTVSGTHPDSTGNYYLRWDVNNTLQFDANPWSIINDVPISYVFYDATKKDGIYFEERHGALRNKSWHYSDHYNRGTFWHTGEGLGIDGYSLQPAIPSDDGNKWTITAGELHDEDISVANTGHVSGTTYTVFHRTGASGEWTWDTVSVPLIVSGTYVAYNQYVGGAWQETPVTVNNYVNYYVMGTTSLDSRFDILVIQGQSTYASLAGAQAENLADLSFGTLPFQEILGLYKITFRTNASYGSTGKCRIEYVTDTRLSTGRQVINASPSSNHNSLSGLQGGQSTEYYHLTSAQYTGLTDGGSTTLHRHPVSGGSNSVCDGRLTLVSGTPVPTTDVAETTELWYQPYIGNNIALYDGVSNWNMYEFDSTKISTVGMVSGTNHDIFAYASGTNVLFENVAWTNDSTRATALVYVDGILSKSGDTAKRLLGTIRTNAATKIIFTQTKRFVSNVYNQRLAGLFTCPGYVDNNSATTYTITATTFAEMNGGVGSKLEFVYSIPGTINFAFASYTLNSSGGSNLTGVAINSATSPNIVAANAIALQYSHFGDSKNGQAISAGFNYLDFLGVRAVANAGVNADVARFGAASDPYATYMTAEIFV